MAKLVHVVSDLIVHLPGTFPDGIAEVLSLTVNAGRRRLNISLGTVTRLRTRRGCKDWRSHGQYRHGCRQSQSSVIHGVQVPVTQFSMGPILTFCSPPRPVAIHRQPISI